MFLTNYIKQYDDNELLRREIHKEFESKLANILYRADLAFEKFELHNLSEIIELPEIIQNSFKLATEIDIVTISDIKKARQILIQEKMGNVNEMRWKLNNLLTIDKWITQTSAFDYIEDELSQILNTLSERERYILECRFDTKRRVTLEEIGLKIGVTRERIRQIEDRVLRKLTTMRSRFPSFLNSKAALALISKLGDDFTFDYWIKSLQNFNFIRDESGARLLLAVNIASSESIGHISEEHYQALHSNIPPRINKLAREIVIESKKTCKYSGVINIKDLFKYCSKKADIIDSLNIYGFTEIDNGWFTKGLNKTVIEHVISKTLYYCGRITPAELRDCLGRYLYRYKYPAPPTLIIIKLLGNDGRYNVSSDYIELKDEPLNKPQLSETESAYLELVNAEGPVVPFESIFYEITSRNYTGIAVAMMLKYSPIVKRISSALYTIYGMSYNDDDIAEAKSKVTKVKRIQNIKIYSNGTIEYITNITPWTLYGDATNCSRIAQLQGNWPISNMPNNKEIIIKNKFILGLLEIVSLLGLKLGEKIKMEFNTWSHTVCVSKV